MVKGPGPVSVYLVRGEDSALVGQVLRDLLTALVSDRDPAMVVEEHGGGGTEEVDVGVVVDALTTPPMLSDRRVVVLREAGRLLAADAARIAGCLEDPVPGVSLVLASGGGTVPSALVKLAQSKG
ncbi:MAG: hypothetical protein ACRDV4_11980, partial [Acidimicrobiales bacterium]